MPAELENVGKLPNGMTSYTTTFQRSRNLCNIPTANRALLYADSATAGSLHMPRLNGRLPVAGLGRDAGRPRQRFPILSLSSGLCGREDIAIDPPIAAVSGIFKFTGDFAVQEWVWPQQVWLVGKFPLYPACIQLFQNHSLASLDLELKP